MRLLSSWCVMCRKSEESTNHLFLRCEVASRFWEKLCKEVNFSWAIIPFPCEALLMESIDTFGKGRKAKTLWRNAVSAIFWVIWNERSSRSLKESRGDSYDRLWDRVHLFASFGCR